MVALMIRLIERSHVPASPGQVWAWFAAIDAHYRDWHSAHIEWRTLKGTPVPAGSVVFFDEWIGRFRLRMSRRALETLTGR